MARKLILAVLAVFVLVPFIFAAEITGSATVTTVGQYLWRACCCMTAYQCSRELQ